MKQNQFAVQIPVECPDVGDFILSKISTGCFHDEMKVYTMLTLIVDHICRDVTWSVLWKINVFSINCLRSACKMLQSLKWLEWRSEWVIIYWKSNNRHSDILRHRAELSKQPSRLAWLLLSCFIVSHTDIHNKYFKSCRRLVSQKNLELVQSWYQF